MRGLAIGIALVLLWAGAVAAPAAAQVQQNAPGLIESLPPPSPHWLLVGDPVLRRAALVDLDDGRVLGIVPSGWGTPDLRYSKRRGTLYVPETHYSRGVRGERTDVVSIVPLASLAAEAEIVLPPRRAAIASGGAVSALSDDERFAFVWNLTPATSVSVIDLDARRVTSEIETPGCSLVYAAGPRRFAMLCADGALLLVSLDEAGLESGRARSQPFFDPETDPITDKGVRLGSRWLFASFEGRLHEVDLAGETPVFGSPWSLFSEAELDDDWRIGGRRHLAVHGPSRRLYSLVHRGGPDTHKQGGTEVWVYDLDERVRVQRIRLRHPGLSVLGFPIEAPEDLIWPLRTLAGFLIERVPLPVDDIAVTDDDAPLLATTSGFSGGVGVYDARSGEMLRRVYTGNAATAGIFTLRSRGER